MAGVKMDKKGRGRKRSITLVLILILHIGGVFSAPKNTHTSFDYAANKGQDKSGFQEFTNSDSRFYKIPLYDGDLAVFIRANTFKKLVNPYPSNLNALKFMEDNKDLLEGNLYVLAMKSSEKHPRFSVQNLAMDVTTTTKNAFIKRNHTTTDGKTKIGVGQVFYVMAKTQDGFVRFNNSQRIRQVQQENMGVSMLKLGLDYANFNGVIMHRQLGVSFKEENTYNHESGYDSELYDLHTNENDMYWDFGNGKKYVIAGLSKFDVDLEIPLVFHIRSEDTIRLTLDMTKNINQKVYLYDKVTHKKVRLLETGVILDLAKGIYSNRFYIGFHPRVLGVTALLEHQFEVSYSKNTGIIKIDCSSDFDFKKVTLTKLLGKELACWSGKQFVQNKVFLSEVALVSGIYLLKVETKQGVVIKKMLVN